MNFLPLCVWIKPLVLNLIHISSIQNTPNVITFFIFLFSYFLLSIFIFPEKDDFFFNFFFSVNIKK